MPANLAVAWCELMISPNSVGRDDIWPALRKLEIEEALGVIQETIKEIILEGSKGRHLECLEATNTQEFRNYLAAKLGLM